MGHKLRAFRKILKINIYNTYISGLGELYPSLDLLGLGGAFA